MSMKLTLRHEWKPRPLNSFLGFVDLKLGVTLVLLFAVFNKVAGVYGLIAMLTGAGGSFPQLSLYIYSVGMLVALWWGMKSVSDEDPKHTLYFAHLFFADHVLSTAWTAYFAFVWWVYTPHDGKRQSHSAAQQYIIEVAGGGHEMTDQERMEAAQTIWQQEKSTAAAIIVAGWFAKIYFAILPYSYAAHLRRGSYRNLPRTNNAISDSADYIPLHGRHLDEEGVLGLGGEADIDDEDEVPADDFYHAASSKGARHHHHHSSLHKDIHNPPLSARTPGTSGSITSFADFISAPSSARAGRFGRGSRPGSASFRSSEFPRSPATANARGATDRDKTKDRDVAGDSDEVLFDSDEPSGSRSAWTSSTTEENASVSSSDARDEGQSSSSKRHR